MDIRQLTYFTHVVDLGSFSRAAAFLHIAQPALSRQIMNLETELKQRLLIRNGRGAMPTEAGKRLLAHARLIIEVFERAHEDMENARLGRTASIAIGMPGSLSNTIGTVLMRQLATEMPDTKVHVLVGRSTQLQEWLLSGRLDIAVLFDAPNSPMLEIYELFEDKLNLIEPLPADETATEAGDIPLAELSDLPLIMSSRPSRVREILELAFAKMGRKLPVQCELDSLPVTFDMVQDGVGRTVSSGRLYHSLAKDRRIRVRRIVQPQLSLKVQIVRRSRRLNSQTVDAAFELLRSVCLSAVRH
jgi:LysR family nitrogen assimilation transcriptional regulator